MDETVIGARTRGSAGGQQLRRARRQAWTKARRERFLATLADTANAALAAEAAGMSRSAAYAERQRCADFAAAWRKAVDAGIDRLETVVLDRALNGTEQPVVRAGRQVAVRTVFSERLAMFLLKAHRPQVYGAPTARARFPDEPPPITDVEEARTRLLAKLSEINRRMGGDG